jgi:hypothetical protein
MHENTETKGGKMSKAEAGRLGGMATVTRHGSMHMTAIAYGAAIITAERHFGGDVAAMMVRVRASARAGEYDERLACHVTGV